MTVTDVTGATAQHTSFLEIVCWDEDLLRAEFDEIVAVGFDGPHRALPIRPVRRDGGRRPTPSVVSRRPTQIASSHYAPDVLSRERSPPRAATTITSLAPRANGAAAAISR